MMNYSILAAKNYIVFRCNDCTDIISGWAVGNAWCKCKNPAKIYNEKDTRTLRFLSEMTKL